MPLTRELEKALDDNDGIITTAKANEIGISNERLRLLVKEGVLERVSFGVYITAEEFVDKMYIMQLRRPIMIYSHETALYLHDLTDRDPLRYAITVPTGYSTNRLRDDGLKVYTIKKELYDVGLSKATTIFGHEVNVYNMERTICDCLRSRNQMDVAILTDAVKRYSKRKDKDLTSLMEMAEKFRVTKLIRTYMEVLL